MVFVRLQDNRLSLLFTAVFEVVSVGLLMSQGANSHSCSSDV